jgi:hypothetical protein
VTQINARLARLEREAAASQSDGLLVYEEPAAMTEKQSAAWLERQVPNRPALVIAVKRFGNTLDKPRLVHWQANG